MAKHFALKRANTKTKQKVALDQHGTLGELRFDKKTEVLSFLRDTASSFWAVIWTAPPWGSQGSSFGPASFWCHFPHHIPIPQDTTQGPCCSFPWHLHLHQEDAWCCDPAGGALSRHPRSTWCLNMGTLGSPPEPLSTWIDQSKHQSHHAKTVESLFAAPWMHKEIQDPDITCFYHFFLW